MSFKILGYKYERNVIKHVLESKNHSEIMVIEVKVVNKLVVSLYETVMSGKKKRTTKKRLSNGPRVWEFKGSSCE